MIAVQFSKYCNFSHRRQTSQAPSGPTLTESYGFTRSQQQQRQTILFVKLKKGLQEQNKLK